MLTNTFPKLPCHASPSRSNSFTVGGVLKLQGANNIVCCVECGDHHLEQTFRRPQLKEVLRGKKAAVINHPSVNNASQLAAHDNTQRPRSLRDSRSQIFAC